MFDSVKASSTGQGDILAGHADRILVRVLAAVDATWLPDRRPHDQQRHTLIYERRRDYHASGIMLSALAGDGARDAERQAASRAVRDLVRRKLLTVRRPKWARTVAYRLTGAGDRYGRALVGLPQVSISLLRKVRDADAPVLHAEGTLYDQHGAHGFAAEWHEEVALLDSKRRRVRSLEQSHLPHLVRGWIISGCDANGRTWYAVTPTGAAVLDDPPTAAKVKLPVADPELVALYHDTRQREIDRLETSPPKYPNDVGELPLPGDPERRRNCKLDFRRFCETYFPAAFTLAWSDDHLQVIARMQDAVLHGGLFALAMPRGSGKTTLCERAALWALLYGHRRFACLVGATEKRAGELLDHLKTELTCNDLLLADFPHVCYPLRRLNNNARNCGGQLWRGEPTRIQWLADRVTLPTMLDSTHDAADVSGSTCSVAGLTGALRGQSHTLASGEIVRPELVILDDPQTRESAMSPSQSAERANIINADVLGMAGPGRKIAAIMPCTVIRSGDMADVLLDRDKCPRWQGQRCKMLYSLPTDEKLWEQYAKLRAESFRKGGNGSEATAFYAEHREAMDAGAVVAWEARHHSDELSAIQHAMNLKLDNEAAFAAEYQNEPIRVEQGDGPTLSAGQIAAKVNGIRRGMVPVGAEHLTAFIDVHETLLYYVVCAWGTDFVGWIIDYGTWPDQHRRYFVMRKAARTLAALSPGAGREGAIRSGLAQLSETLLLRDWEREDGARMRIEKCLIDAGFVPDVVHDVCRHSTHAGALMPSRGVGIGAAGRPMSEYSRTRGDRIGFNWYIPAPSQQRGGRHFRFDTNFWKSFVASRLLVALGDAGSLSLYGSNPEEHRLLADHCCAEVPVRTSGHGRSLDEWRQRPDKPDNHFWDCLVGCAAAASLAGVAVPGTSSARPTNNARSALPRVRPLFSL